MPRNNRYEQTATQVLKQSGTVITHPRLKVGSLCKRGHDWNGTGGSLRYKRPRICVVCDRERKDRLAAEARTAREAAREAAKPPEGHKRCPRCEGVKLLTEFGSDARNAVGAACYCLECFRRYRKARYAKHGAALRFRSRSLHRKYWMKTLLLGSRSSARTRNLSHSLTIDDLKRQWDAQGGICYWLGIPMITEFIVARHPLRVSLERLDNDKGYEPGNIVFATWFANVGRGRVSVDEFRTIVAHVQDARPYDAKMAIAYKKHGGK